jgi:4-diphosphocytidyl-2-C-methyl-D-erythritol kinase
MAVAVRSFAKINLGLIIGPRRADGFHELRTVYQTISLHDTIRLQTGRGIAIEVRCKDRRVPEDESNTCYRIADRALKSLRQRSGVIIQIDKKLPVQGGLGGASSNAVATLLALEVALKTEIAPDEKLRLAAQVGSDLPLFLVGGAVLGLGHGEEVYPLPELPSLECVVATPNIAISTPKAFEAWDEHLASEANAHSSARHSSARAALAEPAAHDRITLFSRSVFSWLSSSASGVPARKGGDRAETLLLDLVRAGIENDFERVVFPQYPELRDVKRALERAGAAYASLSGSGSAVYGLFADRAAAEKAAAALDKEGVSAQPAHTLTRQEYWQKLLAE